MSAVAWPLGYMVGGMIGSILIGTITGTALLGMLRENRGLLDDFEKQRAEAKA